MSRISSGKFDPVQQSQNVVDGPTPGRPIASEPTRFNIPVPIEIIPFGPTVGELAPHHEAEPPPVLTIGNPIIGPTPSTVTTTTTTTTTPDRGERVGPTPILRMEKRGLSVHRMRGRVAKGEETLAPRLAEPSLSESSSQSAEESPKSFARDFQVFRKVNLNKNRSESRLK